MNPIGWILTGVVTGTMAIMGYGWHNANNKLNALRTEYTEFRAGVKVLGEVSETERQTLVKGREDAKKTAETASLGRVRILESRNASLSADRQRLLDTIAARAGGSTPGNNSAAANCESAEALGLVLGKADERAERDHRELESVNEEKRLLLEAWPNSKTIF